MNFGHIFNGFQRPLPPNFIRRPGTKCHELRERLAGLKFLKEFVLLIHSRSINGGGYGGRQITLLAPTNNAIKKAAEAGRETQIQHGMLLCS